MKIYNIKPVSPWLYLLTYLTFIFIAILLIIIIDKKPSSALLIFIICMGIAYLLSRYIPYSDIEITLDKKSIRIKWIRQFIFHNKPDIKIILNEIIDYVVQPNNQFYLLKFRLKNSSEIKIHHNNRHDLVDDFRSFLEDFKREIKDKKKKKSNKDNIITLGKNKYETTSAIFLSIIFFILIVLVIPYILFTHPPKKPSNYAMLGLIYFSAIYYIIQVYRHIRNKKKGIMY